MHGRSLARRRLAVRCALVTTAAATAFAGFSAIAPAHAAEGPILGADSADRIDGSYIVVLKGNPSVGSTADRLTDRHGGTVKKLFTTTLNGFALKADEASARKMAADPAVEYVEADRELRITGTQPNPPSWGLDRIDQAALPLDRSYTYPNSASNVHAYIIDTGIRTTHSDFGGRASWGTNTADSNNTDCHGHGTHVAGTTGGTAHGVAKGVKLVAVKVLNCLGSGTTSGVIAGVEWVTNNAVKPAVANMSLGGGASTALDNAVTASIDSGITYALAAGNESTNACNSSPARTPKAITVGATTNSDARSSFSNYGTCLDIFAPGSSITSAWSSSDSATNTISGTSMASPHVAGAAALIASANPSWTPQQIRDKLVADATSGAVTSPGTGSPNKLLRVLASDDTPANDFSISVSPGSGSVQPGGTVSTTIRTAVTSGSAESVKLTAEGLPAGATATFSPSSVTAGGSATMTVSASASTAPGTYTVTVTGTSASAEHQAKYTLTVGGGDDTCTSPGQKLTNPGFESGTTGWTTSPTPVIGQWGPRQPAHSGTWSAWLAGYGSRHSDHLTQAVSLPDGCSAYTLSFWLHIDTAETTTSRAYDTLRVQVLSADGSQVLGTLKTYSNLDAGSGYTQRSLDLGAYAGQDVRIRFLGEEDSLLYTSFVVDDTALEVS